MADPALRRLERALSLGEEAARLPLATAYLRLGDAPAAVAVLDGGPLAGAPGDAGAPVREAVWRRALALLEPDEAIPGLRRASAREALVGWCGPGARFAVLQGDRGAVVLDVRARRVVVEADLPHGLTAVATTPGALYGVTGRSVVRAAPPASVEGPWRLERMATTATPTEVRPAPDDRSVLVPVPGTRAVVSWPDGEIRRLLGAHAACDVDWARGRVAWLRPPGVVFTAEVAPGAPPRSIDLVRACARAAPARAAGRVGPGAGERDGPARATGRAASAGEVAAFGFLGDGRLFVDPPGVLLDLDAEAAPGAGEPGPAEAPGDGARSRGPGAVVLELPRGEAVEGPFRLASDGQALLAFRGGAPARLPLRGRVQPPAWRGGGGGGLWHPRADAAAVLPGAGPPELRAADGTRIRPLPRDARPLGWTPDGRGLLVLRHAGAAGGILELWTVPGAQPAGGP